MSSADLLNAGLKEILEKSNILKVIHDSRSDVDALHHLHKISCNPIFDTQACFAYV
jgi:ribonuclease D